MNLAIFRSRKTYLIAFIVLISIWLFYGMFFPKKNQEKSNAEAENIVKTETFKSTQKEIVINAYGLTDSKNKVIVYSEVSGLVVEKIANDGDVIKKEDPIVKIDLGPKDAQLKQVKALLSQRQIEYDADKKLQKSDYVSEAKLKASFTALKAAEASLQDIENSVDKNFIKAEISGIVDKISVSEGDFVTAGSTVITKIIDPESYMVTCYISERDILKVKKDSGVTVVFIDDKKIDGKIDFISSISEPKTRTFRVDIKLDIKDAIFIPLGTSVKLNIATGCQNAYKIPGSAIYLNDDGIIGIKAVRSGMVKFIPVTVLEEDIGYFWIAQDKDMEDQIDLITFGGNFVRDGDHVSIGESPVIHQPI